MASKTVAQNAVSNNAVFDVDAFLASTEAGPTLGERVAAFFEGAVHKTAFATSSAVMANFTGITEVAALGAKLGAVRAKVSADKYRAIARDKIIAAMTE